MVGMSGFPIAVLAFNRPDYLRAVLESLVQQQGVDIAKRPIALFQDGGFNEHSRIQRAEPKDVEASIAVFCEFFPNARIEASPVNLGIAFNFDRAERWAFEELNAEGAIFLEDDMVLSPHYIAVLDQMLAMAIDDPRIGYVAAYGSWQMSLEKQKICPGRLKELDLYWAFGQSRRQWLKNRPFIKKYLSLIEGYDYRLRPYAEIYEFFVSHGGGSFGTTQDVAKKFATALSSAIGVNTTACLSKYIGERGTHFDKKVFQNLKLEQTEVYPWDEDFKIEPLSEDRHRALVTHSLLSTGLLPPLLEFGSSLSFAHSGGAKLGLREGFGEPESWGVWSASKRSILSYRLSKGALRAGSVLWLDATYNLPPQVIDIDLRVRVNGQDAATVTVGRHPCRIRINIPPSDSNDDHIKICLDSPLIGSPKQFGTGKDTRPLTLGLTAIGLERAPK